jgi:hypothetical protein
MVEAPQQELRRREVVALALVATGALAAIALLMTAVGLLIGMKGPGCHGEYPVCTTPSQESVRRVFAIYCGIGVLAYLLAARPALRARRLGVAQAFVIAVIVLAAVAVAVDPASHLQSEAGRGQWFVSGGLL